MILCLRIIDPGDPGSSCGNEALEGTLRCHVHLEGTRDQYELALAQEYAVASILYYEHDKSMMSDARFDGTCDFLLRRGTYRRIPWIEHDALIAGTGYDIKKFPEYLHLVARKMKETIT